MLQCENTAIQNGIPPLYASQALCEKTLKQSIHCRGVGIHSGKPVTMILEPAPVGSGIRFQRDDIEVGDNQILASWDHVEFTTLCTEIGNKANAVAATTEHLMAAFAGLGIDNVRVRLDSAELPIMDGSAYSFVFLLQSVGVVSQNAPRKFIKIIKPVEVCEGSSTARLEPTDEWHFRLNMRIHFPKTAIGEQRLSYVLGDDFAHEIARARTYGFVGDLAILRENGLAQGACTDNSIAIDGYDVLNESGLRYQDEFVRHKILDALGDLYLAGKPLIAEFYGDCSGHKLNNELLHKLFANQSNWQLVSGVPEYQHSYAF